MTTKAAKDREEEKNNVTSNQGSEEAQQLVLQSYGKIFHPGKTWVDVLITLIFPCIPMIPMGKFGNYLPTSKSTETMKFLQNFHSTFHSMAHFAMEGSIKKWSKAIDCPIVKCVHQIPRRNKILHELGIIEERDDILDNLVLPESDKINVLTLFPSSLLPKDERVSVDTTKGKGYQMIEEIDFSTLPTDIPLLIWFHGGGYVIGTNEDASIVNDAISLQKIWKATCDKENDSCTPEMIIVSVKYSLAPEFPFPACIIDALSVVTNILNLCSSRKIHLAGGSAGGHLALATGFEIHRKYPGRLSSIHAHTPKISPSADSISFYRNLTSLSIAPASFVRWGWQALLEMKPPVADTFTSSTRGEEKGQTIDEILRKGSNYDEWMKSKWRAHNTTRRLIELLYDIPDGLDYNTNKAAPKFVITTSQADVLHDEGVLMYHALKQRNAHVIHTDATGEHTIGYNFDSVTNQKRLEAWANAIWRS